MPCQPQNIKIQLLTDKLHIIYTAMELQHFSCTSKKNLDVALAEVYLFACQIRVIQVFCVLCSWDTLWTLTNSPCLLIWMEIWPR